MDEVTQQNAALVEEAAAAAQSLEDQAGRLREAVAVFNLEDAALGAAQVKPAPAAARTASVARAAATRQASGAGAAAPAAKRAPRSTPAAAAAQPAARPVAAPRAPMSAVASAAGSNGDWETF
ncbi:hypothetical protein AB3X91_38715, partial [Paraburkholderia sp. BR14263]